MWKALRKRCGAPFLSVDKNVGVRNAFQQGLTRIFSPQTFFRFSTEKCGQLELMFEEIERIVEAMRVSDLIRSSILRMDESTVAWLRLSNSAPISLSE